MKKFFSRFVKNEKGVVMMEYVLLGCFAVAVTSIAVMVLGSAYGSGINTLSLATVGDANAACNYLKSAKTCIAQTGVPRAQKYANDFDKDTEDADWAYSWDQ